MRTSSFALASLLSLLAFDPIFSVEAQSEYWLTQYSPAIANAFTSLKISTARLSNNVAEDGYFKLHLPEGTDINYDPKSPFACNVSDYSPHGFNPATRQNIDTTVDFSGKTPTVMISPAEGTIFREKHGVSISCDNILLPAVVDHIDLKIGTQYNSSESAEVTIATDLDPLKYACPLSGARFSGNVNAEKADLLIKLRKSPFTHPADTKIRITPNFDIPADAPLSCVGYETKSEIVEGVLKYVELTPSKKIYADTNAVFKCGQITVPDVTDATVTVEVFQQNEKLLSSSTVPLTNPSLNDVGVLGGASANISLGPTLSGVALTLDLETVGVELVKGESILIPLHPESEPTDLVFTTTLKKSDAVFVGKAEYYVRDGFESTLAIRLTVESGVVQADDSFKVVIDSLTPPRYDTPIYLHILAADIEGKTKADVIVVSDDVKIIFPFAEDLTAAYSEKVGSKTSTLSITGTSTGLHMRENNSLLVQLPPKSNLISKSSKLVCACSTNELGCSQKYKAELLRPNTDDPALSITLLESSRIRNVDRFSIHCNGLDVPTTATTASKLNIAAYETADEKSRRLGAGTVNFQSAEDYSNIVGKAQTSYMKFADTIGSTTSSLKFNIEDVKTEVPANAVVVFKVPEFTEYTSKNPERNVSCTLNGENTEAKVILTKGSNSRVESIAVALPKGVKKSKNITIECEKFSVPLTASKAQKLDISIYKTYLENEKAVFARDVLDFKPAEVANVGSGENVNNNLNVYAPVTSTGIYSYFIGSSPVDIYPGAIFSFAVAASTPYPDVNMVSCFQASRKFSVTFDKDSQGMLSRVNAFFTSGPIMIRGLPIAFGCENLYISHHAVNPTTKYPTTISYKGTVFANGDLMMKNPAPPAAIGIKGGSHVKFLTSFDTKQDTSSVHFSISTVGVNVPNRSKITFALPEGLALRYSTKDSTKVLSNCKSATVKITSVKQVENRLYVGVVTNKDSKDEQNALYSNESFHMICDDVLTDRRTLDVLTTDVYIHDRQLPFTNAFGRGVLNIGRVVAADLGEVYSSISLLENYAVAEPSHFMATYYPLHVGLVAGDAISIQVPSLWIFPTFDPTSPDARVMINGEERHIFSTPDSVCWVSINDANPLTKTATARTEYIEMTSEAGADDYYRTLRVTLLESLPALDKVNNHYTVRVVCENVRPPVVVVSYRKPYTTAIHTARGDKLVQSGRMIVRDTPYLKPIVKTEVAKFVLQRPARRPFGDFETLSFITAFSKTLGGSSSNYSIMKQEIVPKKRKYQHHIDLIIRPSNKVEIDEAKAKLTHLVKVGFADFQNRLALEKVSKLISFDFAEYVVPEHCYNGIKDEDESDIDCGGACFACTTGKTCTTSTSCASGYCTDMKTFYFNAETKANVEETERICVDVANPSRQYSGPYY